MDFAGVALQQHLGRAGGAAEVAVDLKWRMQIPQVRQRRLGEQRLVVLPRLLAIFEARPEVDDPRAAPAGVAAAVREAALDRRARGLRQGRSATQRDLIARV